MFQKGNRPWNKNKKGIHLSPKSEFKKGNHPKTQFQKGTENRKSITIKTTTIQII